LFGQSGCDQIVAALDPVHLPRHRRGVFIARRELVDEFQHRQFLRVGEEESAQAGGRGAQFVVGADVIQPLRNGASRDIASDGRLPPSLRQTVGPAGIRQRLGQARPAIGERAADDADRAVGTRSRVGEAAPENPDDREAQFLGELMHLDVAFVDHVATGFGVLRFDESLSSRLDAAADVVARFDHGHVRAPPRKIARGAEAGQARSGHQHRHAAQITGHGEVAR
jgi:hypothetical protein